ncbi:MAG: isocitrate lyase/phosphoenolpyruvate mutase family protein [Candidatus Binatia bacterium]
MRTQAEKVQTFRGLHARAGAFLIPNPWDVGTARLLTGLGFEALATTSAGYAFSIGKRDSAVGREPMLAHVADIVAATDLPVNADLENGFGDDPKIVAETIRRAAATGIAGGSIEDATGRATAPLYPIPLAAERVRAAAEAVRALRVPFVLTARAENFVAGRPDLADTIARLQAYQAAGADVLFAPGLVSADDIATVVRSVDRPVNVLMGRPAQGIDLQQLGALGVKRVSVGSALSRVALGAFLRAARELKDHGTFELGADAVPYDEINALFES